MIYRSFCLRDLGQVEGISKGSFPVPLSKIAIVLLSVICRVYVAVEGRNVAGYLILGEKSAGELFIFHLAVRREYRSRGVASGFIKSYVDRMCYVRTHVSNADAQKFYKKHKFNVLNRARYADEEEEYLMVRKL